MIVPIPYVHAGMGLLMIVLSVPLILRKVPMNQAYGIRVRKAFVSENNWYEINAYGGKLLFVLGLLLLAFVYFTKDSAPSPTSLWAPVYLIVPLLALVSVLVLINVFARGLPEE